MNSSFCLLLNQTPDYKAIINKRDDRDKKSEEKKFDILENPLEALQHKIHNVDKR